MLFINSVLYAQTNSNKTDTTKIPKSHLFGKVQTMLSFGSSFFTGNVKSLDLHGEGSVANKDTIFEWAASLKGIYDRLDTVVSNREFSGSLKFDYVPYHRISPFLMFSFFSNQYKGIDMRLSGLAGAKYLIYHSPKADYSISAAAVYDNEQYIPSANKANTDFMRISIRPKFSQKLGDKFTLEDVTFFKINAKNSSDYIIDSTTKLSTQMTKKLYIEFDYTYGYVNQTPDVKILKTDQSFITAIVLKF